MPVVADDMSPRISSLYICVFVYMFVYMVGEEGNDQMIREVRAYMVFVYLYGEAS